MRFARNANRIALCQLTLVVSCKVIIIVWSQELPSTMPNAFFLFYEIVLCKGIAGVLTCMCIMLQNPHFLFIETLQSIALGLSRDCQHRMKVTISFCIENILSTY